MRRFLLLIFILFSLLSFGSQPGESNRDSLPLNDSTKIKLSFLPLNHVIPLFTANASAHRLSISKVTNNNNYIASMGGIFPVLSARHKSTVFQFSVAGTVYSQLIRPPGHLIVETVDYFADLFFDIAFHKNFALRLGSGHTSQHFTDDALEVLGHKHSINYVRDYYQMFAVYKSRTIRGFVYGGGYYNYHFLVPYSVSKTFIYEIGSEHTPFEIRKGLFLFLGFDIKFRGELGYRTSQNYQLGLKYLNESGRTIRFAINERRGIDERGQFYNQTDNFTSISAYFDF